MDLHKQLALASEHDFQKTLSGKTLTQPPWHRQNDGVLYFRRAIPWVYGQDGEYRQKKWVERKIGNQPWPTAGSGIRTGVALRRNAHMPRALAGCATGPGARLSPHKSKRTLCGPTGCHADVNRKWQSRDAMGDVSPSVAIAGWRSCLCDSRRCWSVVRLHSWGWCRRKSDCFCFVLWKGKPFNPNIPSVSLSSFNGPNQTGNTQHTVLWLAEWMRDGTSAGNGIGWLWWKRKYDIQLFFSLAQ